MVAQSEDVKAVGVGPGGEQAISILATYVSELDEGFDRTNSSGACEPSDPTGHRLARPVSLRRGRETAP